MSDIVIKVESVSKQYRLGKIGTGTFSHDINRWWQTMRGREDPYLKIGEVNDRSKKSESEYVWALKNISFAIKQGDVVGIIGKNGAGKSTLLKILSRTTLPTTGSIKIKGRVASLLEVGTGFHPELTGRENIFLNGAILGMSKAEIRSKFDEIVDFSGVEKYIDTPVKRYSSGMYVRLAFAVAAHLEPEILIVDEVLAVGDADFQRKALGKMQDVSKNGGRTVLFVSHNMGSVQSLCTQGLLLSNGVVSFKGTSDDTISKYLSGSKESLSNLIDVADRKGAGNIIFTKVELGNNNNYSDVFKLGDSIKFQFKVKVKNALSVNRLRVLVGIYNEREEGILRFDSDVNSVLTIDEKFKEGIITCQMEDHLTIMPGKYSVNIALFNNGEMEDYIAGKILFDVVNDNYLGGSRTLDSNHLAKVLYRHSWDLKNIYK